MLEKPSRYTASSSTTNSTAFFSWRFFSSSVRLPVYRFFCRRA